MWNGMARAVRIGSVDTHETDLFDFRRVFGVPTSAQVLAVCGLFVTTVLCTHAEYVESGTVFGYPGPGFNVLVAPIYEELIFRGWILSRLVKHLGNLRAIVASSLLFGLVHIRNIYWVDTDALIEMMLYTGLVAGPILAWTTLKARSLWPAVILHYLNNLGCYVRDWLS